MDAGHRLEAMREWREARHAYLEAVKVNPLDSRGLGFLAVFLSTCPMGTAFLRAGRPEEAQAAYRDALAVLERLPPEIRDRPGVQNGLAWLLATCPIPGLRNPARGVELARLNVERAPNSFTWNTLGVAKYRAGDCKAAINALEKSEALEPDKDHKNVLAFNGFFLAMAHWQLGQKDPAYTWYDRSIEWMDKNQPWLDMNSGENEELKRLRTEAAALLGVPDLPADVFAWPEAAR